jgi:Sec-independent protein secretion pathway component TatC
MTMLMMAIPLVILFMISVYFVKLTQGKRRKARLLSSDDDESPTNPFE